MKVNFPWSAPENDGPHGPNARDAVAHEGFQQSWDVEGVASLASVIAQGERCGIYMLAFTTGEWYVGQAVDVARRFLDHRDTHSDIARVFFKPVEPEYLDQEERRLIGLVETDWGWPVRNIRGASLPKGIADLHDLVAEQDLKKWVLDASHDIDLGTARAFEDQARKLATHQSALDEHPRGEDVRRLTAQYLAKAVPAPRATELEFWSLSCMPDDGYPLVRVNLHWQEVFALFDGPTGVSAAFQVARTPLVESLFARLAFRLRHLAVRVTPHAYEPGGADQVRVQADGADSIERLMGDARFLRAVRTLNSRLMQKGRVNPGNAASHCAGWVSGLEIERYVGSGST